jgi:hypothetical protein
MGRDAVGRRRDNHGRSVISSSSPFNNWGDFFSIPIPIEFGAGIGFPIMKLNSNDLLIIL